VRSLVGWYVVCIRFSSEVNLLSLATKLCGVVVFFLVLATLTTAQIGSFDPDPDEPYIQYVPHNQGNIQLAMNNFGVIGQSNIVGWAIDPLTGESVRNITFPHGSGLRYGFGTGLWVGAIVGYDTLVSIAGDRCPQEFWPDLYPFGEFDLKSIDISRDFYDPEAYSELDLTCEYFDSLTDPEWVCADDYTHRPHRPLGLRVSQRSMAWSGAYLGDFVLINYQIANIGDDNLEKVFIGFESRASAQGDSSLLTDFGVHAVAGFLETYPSPEGCGEDAVNIAYYMDNDGNPSSHRWDSRSPRAAIGLRVLGMAADSQQLNFNWYSQLWSANPMVSIYGNWGPRIAGTVNDPFRNIGSGIGFPEGDGNRYYIMAHPEFDYDQLFCALDHTTEGWLPPALDREEYAKGGYANSLLSFGPFDLPRHTSAEFTIAIVAGDSVHLNPTDYEDLWNPYYPWPYYESLDFSRLARSANWAKWVYDNPGFDTDGDGYRGEFRMCDGDTFWYEGDGIPDFRADLPPPAPFTKVTPHPNKLVIRWNGYLTETHIDPFTQVQDFEGYRLYVGLDSRKTSLSILASYDWENYNRFKFIQRPSGEFVWVNTELPFTLDSLKTFYDNPQFDPLVYTKLNPLVVNDTLFYFTKQDFNQFDLGPNSLSGIHKVYPDASEPGLDTLLWTEDDLTFEHGQPLPKFYEYEYIYDKLLGTVPYYVSVTAFDFGFASGGIPAKESNILNNIIEAFAQVSADTVEALQLDAYVYPNPYRADEDYLERGFENRDRSGMRNRARRIHFANLPNVCKISIFSLDGDLVRELDHNFPEGGANAMHESWDFITRNAQLVMPGLFYYVIESEGRTQIGKFVIIM
jgi:hypothetical protein